MGTSEHSETPNANTTSSAVSSHQPQNHHLQQPQQQCTQQRPKSSPAPPPPPPQIIIVPATQASTVATNAAKKIRRAFSMPRNPFRWSRKFKTSTTADNASSAGGSNSAISSCVGGGRGRAGSIVSLNSYEAICKDTNGNVKHDENGTGDVEVGGGKTSGAAGTNASGNNANEQQRKSANMPVSSSGNGNNENTNANANNNNNSSNNSHSGGIGQASRILRRSSFRKFLNRIAQHVTTSINVGANKHTATSLLLSSTTDRVPPIGSYQWPADQTPGVMGLKNHGNTCFMNAVLQCLSHTDILAEYFVLDQYKADLKRRNKINSRKFGTKGELTEQLANVLKALWTCKNESDHSTSFKAVVDRYGTQFRSSTQQDAQEFLFWLLDKVHEDLNTATKRRYKSVKNTYGRPDEVIAAETLANHIRCNNSFVQAVFQAQFRSSLTCPRCKKQSNTFDPFHCVSVQLPQLTQQTIFVTVVHLKRYPRQVKIGLMVPAGSPIVALREQLSTSTGIATDHMVLVDINKEGFTRVFYDTQPVVTLNGVDTIYCIETPEKKAEAAKLTSTTPKVNDSGVNSSTAGDSAKTSNSGTTDSNAELLLLIANVHKKKLEIEEQKNDGDKNVTSEVTLERFGSPISMLVPRDCSYTELQKKLLREMSSLLKPEVFSYTTPLSDMFQIRLQDPSADPDAYLQNCEHPLLTEMIDMALSVLSTEAGPAHIKLLLEWSEPEQYFGDLSDTVVEDESVARLMESKSNDTAALTLEQCLEHYTKAETLSAEDAWRCPHCQQYLPVVKTLGLWSLPDILVVHFKRFRQHQEKGGNAAKLTTMVKFPLNAFDMSPHLARGVNDNNRTSLSASVMTDMNSHTYRPSPWKKTRSGDSRSSTLSSRDNKETRYDLYAVCYHQGDTLETGHYTAACKNPYDRQWYKFDDQRVSKVPNDSIEEEIINNEAYMLFYQRRSGEAAECSGSSSNSGDHWVSRIAPPPPLTQADKISVSKETVDEGVREIKANVEIVPENMKTKPVEIPKVKSHIREEINKDLEETSVVPAEELAQLVVNGSADEKALINIGNVEDLKFADDGIGVGEGNNENEDILAVLEDPLINETIANDNEINQIFEMDEDCQINDIVQEKDGVTDSRIKVEAQQEEVSPLLNTSNKTETVTNPTVLTNGYNNKEEGRQAKSPSALKADEIELHTAEASNASTSSSSSTSSLSSRSSPHSLAASVSGVTTLQTKFNGFSTSATVNSYKEALLSSSLKSKGSSISISAAIAGHSHEFQLSRHHQQWNGSQSSVSAVESSTQHTQQHAHCLNLRHSFSTSSNCKLRECNETLSMLRNSANTCSKDTLIFIDQQSHHHHRLIEDDDTFMGSRSLWISPVTPHKLITVSPKN